MKLYLPFELLLVFGNNLPSEWFFPHSQRIFLRWTDTNPLAHTGLNRDLQFYLLSEWKVISATLAPLILLF